MLKTITLNVIRKNSDFWVKVSEPQWAEFLELLREGERVKRVRLALRFEEGDRDIMIDSLRNSILDKIFEYDGLYNRYVRESDAKRRTPLGTRITVLKEELKQLEVRLAIVERRKPRELPLRPLPVRYLKID